MGEIRRALSLYPFLALGLGACTPSGEVSMPRIVDTALEVAQARSADLWSATPSTGGYRVLVQRHGLTRGVEFETGASELTLVSHRWNADLSAVRKQWSSVLSSELRLRAVTAVSTDELVVAGQDASGALRVERWLLEEDAETEATRVTERRTIQELAGIRDVRLLACEPDGRFVLLLDDTGTTLWQIPLGAAVEMAQTFHTAEFPALRDAGTLLIGEHLKSGRVYTFESTLSGQRAVFLDRDLDGVFDGFENLDERAWYSSDYHGSVWLDERLHTPH